MNEKNPHNICTWKDEESCGDCSIKGKLNCRWSRKKLITFYLLNIPSMFFAVSAMLLLSAVTGLWWIAGAYLGYVLLMLGFIETGFLCRHCPYYAENSRTLHCLANHGDLKIWHYNPAPMKRWEKWCMNILVVGLIFVILPLAAEGYGIWFTASQVILPTAPFLIFVTLTAGSAASAVFVIVFLQKLFCARCVNFSCPLNTVPDETVETYLDMNPVMKEAWEKAGWEAKQK